MFIKVEEAIEELQKGNFLIIVDDEERENEGDLVIAGEKATPEKINFMIQNAHGLMCLPISKKIAEQFNLNLMTQPKDKFQTGFTVSVDAGKGITTGVSAKDRIETIKILISEKTNENDLVKPGHLFPLLAKENGVLERAGHTESTVDLLKIAEMKQVGVIAEIMNKDGTMARLPDLKKFADEHKIKILTIKDLIQYRSKTESSVKEIVCVNLPTEHGTFKAIGFTDNSKKEYVALVKGNVKGKENVLVRVHSGCLTGDVFHSKRCDCGSQLKEAMEMIEKEGQGVLLYIQQHEGRGIGLMNKLKTYKLQEEGKDTVEANNELGFEDDLREYGTGAQILSKLGLSTIRLLTNNPQKIVGLEGHGLKITKRIPLKIKCNEHNCNYLETKIQKMGHF
ncbi:MAG: bifunctional 3,4-dihydroxy-2-butanone-4-phosphate synthase/GTP cyclohydrolase II [Candidatus Diapherotrites archaeon]